MVGSSWVPGSVTVVIGFRHVGSFASTEEGTGGLLAAAADGGFPTTPIPIVSRARTICAINVRFPLERLSMRADRAMVITTHAGSNRFDIRISDSVLGLLRRIRTPSATGSGVATMGR
jgi:hypothetical protein